MELRRREWLKKSSLALLSLGLPTLPSFANEEGIRRADIPYAGLINLGANESPYGLSPRAQQAIIDMIKEANRYQFNVTAVKQFRDDLAKKLGVSGNELLITAGSGEALVLLARTFNKGRVIAANPTFGILTNTAKRMGTRIVEVAVDQNKVHDLKMLAQADMPPGSLVYIVNPANPTGTVCDPSTLRSFCEEVSKKATVLIDEAYIDFIEDSGKATLIDLARLNKNILVLRTFSKIYGMAGMRCGYLISHPERINELENSFFSNSQFAVSNMAMVAALASLDDPAFAMSSKKKNKEARDFTITTLKNLGLRVIPSDTNFLFFRIPDGEDGFGELMLSKGIMLRSGPYADGNWGRVSIGTMDEMKKFAAVMQSLRTQPANQ